MSSEPSEPLIADEEPRPCEYCVTGYHDECRQNWCNCDHEERGERESGRPVGTLPEPLRGDGPCQDCGTPDNIRWWTDSSLWNRVMGGPDARDDPGGIVCIPCFATRAAAAGLPITAWRLTPVMTPEDAAVDADNPGVTQTRFVGADRIQPLHQAQDEAKLAALTASMEHAGWTGAAVITLPGTDYGWGEGDPQAITGSHRIAAARAAQIEIPTVDLADLLYGHGANFAEIVADFEASGYDHEDAMFEVARRAGDYLPADVVDYFGIDCH